VRRRLLPIPIISAVAALATASVALAVTEGQNKPLGDNLVGRQSDGSVLTPQNQYVTPAGDTVEQTGRPMDLAVSPDGRTAVDLTKSGDGLFTVVDLVGHKVLQQYSPPRGVGSGKISVGGLLYSKDGRTLWAAETKNILKLAVAPDGTLSSPTVVAMPTTGGGGAAVPTDPQGRPADPLPSDLAFAPDGKILVVLDGYNTLGVLDPATNAVTGQTQVGVAPRDVAVVGGHAFVSNEGGRTPTSTDFTNYSYDSRVVADKADGRADNGTVSEVDLATGKLVNTYEVGLDPSSLLAHGSDLLVTNSSDDTVSVIDTKAQQVTQTFNVNPLPGQPFGSSPNALAFIDDTHLVVSLGRDNALALYDYRGSRTAAGFSGLVPTGWYPGVMSWNATLGRLVVASLKGVGALGADRTVSEGPGTAPATGRQAYADKGTVSLIPAPQPAQMAKYTAQVFANNQWNGLAARNRKGSGHAKPVAVPVRTGDPSKIKHVFLIVKENRTYDQVLGDDPRGNGEPSYAQFGKNVTPNTHALAKQFQLIDNLYSDGTNSAVGHTWLDAGFVNDYLERSYANYVRNYGQPDALVYPKSGFLWDNAQAHGLKAKVWGEYAEYFTAPDGSPSQGTWSQWYHDSQVMEGKAKGPLHAPTGYYQTKADIPSLDRILSRDFPNFQTQIPDQYRADIFLRDLKRYEKKGSMPALNMMWVMDDHTSGSAPGKPIQTAAVADNDLATGRIIDGISHSKFWKDSAVFVVEDDSQNGVDHVDGHRNIALVASPYAKRGAVVPTYYSQLNVTRTIEQILGLPPTNQLDMAAEPMYDAFTNKANNRPFNALPNNIPLDTLNPQPAQVTNPMQKAWLQWSQKQNFGTEDQVAFAPMNRLTWYSTTGYKRPFPGDSKVMTPAEVLARFPQDVPAEGNSSDGPGTRAEVPHKAGGR